MKSGEWLEKALLNLGRNMETGLILDNDLVSGLVSYCESAPPQDAKEYLNNIVGEETGRSVIEEYVKMRGYTDIGSSSSSSASVSNSTLQAYVKPPPDKVLSSGTKKHIKQPKQVTSSSNQENRIPNEIAESGSIHKGKNPKKKKSGKVISLAEAAKGTIVFKQGQPCLCQARQHKLVSNCLSCGKIVCEQEGEGPCSFCGALVLKEGSTYAGLDETGLPLSDAEAVAEAYAKRLVDYDRNSAARTTVIDDQSDYYDIEGNTWLSAEEKKLLVKKQQDDEEADRARRNELVVTFDLVGRKVVVKKDDVSVLESGNRILRSTDEREVNRIKPNPTVSLQPVFVDPGPVRNPVKGKSQNKPHTNGLCLEISGRVQHDRSELQQQVMAEDRQHKSAFDVGFQQEHADEEYECSLDCN